jgi:hypothetical protein
VVRTFGTIEELRAALVEFATRYNETWLVARHGYRTPAEARADQCRLDPNTTADLTHISGIYEAIDRQQQSAPRRRRGTTFQFLGSG